MIDYVLHILLMIAQILGYHGVAGVISVMMLHKVFAEWLLTELMIKFSLGVGAALVTGDVIGAWVMWVIDGVMVVGTMVWGLGAIVVGGVAWVIDGGVVVVGTVIWGVGTVIWGVSAWVLDGVIVVGTVIWGGVAIVISGIAWVWSEVMWVVDGVMVVGAVGLAWGAWAWSWIAWGGPFVLYFSGLALVLLAVIRVLPYILYAIAVIFLPSALLIVFFLSETQIRSRWVLHMLIVVTLTAFDWSPSWLPKPNAWKAFRGWDNE